MSTATVDLEPDERVPARPFTDPEASRDDLARLGQMVRALWLLLADESRWQGRPLPLLCFQPETGPWHSRAVLLQPGRLLALPRLWLVGFFGVKRAVVEEAPLEEAGTRLMACLPQSPDLLSYCTHLLEPGRYGNLILFASAAAIGGWRTHPAHRYAAEELAPGYYRTVRIYNGLMPAGFTPESPFHLLRVKYYDYGGTPPWRAVRHFDEA